jgi:hypothetical protein
VRDGLIYTTGAAFAGLELISMLLIDLGYAKEERQVRKLMVLPPARDSQDPYEVPGLKKSTSFERRLCALARSNLADLDLHFPFRKAQHIAKDTLASFPPGTADSARQMDSGAALAVCADFA